VIKLLQLSFLVLLLAVPIVAARDTSAVRGVRRTIVLLFMTTAAYVVLITFVIPRFV
jgi:hypothetical protein